MIHKETRARATHMTVPVHYALHFEPDLERRTFSGTAQIDVKISSPTRTITMDCAELAIRSSTVMHAGKAMRARARLDAKSEQLTLVLPQRIRGSATIEISFEGTLNDRLLGFYSSTYEYKGKKRRMATTQFEAADARRAFPCWDAPAAKATFDVSITVPKGLRAISNMPCVSRKVRAGKMTRAFARTPKMSTYLLYMGAGDFESISSSMNGVKISVVATRGNAKRGRFALSLTKRLLKEYEKYFGIRYPLPKLDMIAVPDFAAGAMENWGAITFRETLLLYDEKTSSDRTKQLVAEVVSHELAHQWFGNLVTMEWWNDLWLNESFATFMATKFVDKLYPEWSMWKQYASDTVDTALRLDSLRSTHAIDVDVKSPSEVREIFDAISYDKGGAVLQMLERIVGEVAFRRGLRKYLSKFAYRNAKGADLWREIEIVAKTPLRQLIKTWIAHPGYPLLSVTRSKRGARYRQDRFYLMPPARRDPHTWKIPVFVDSHKPKTVSAKTGSLAGVRTGSIVNAQRSAFCRVKYEPDHLEELRRIALEHKMSEMDAWMIQNDILALCRAGQADVRTYLEFTDACATYDGYLVSSSIARNLGFLHRVAYGKPFVWRIRERLYEHNARIHRRLAWKQRRGELHTDSIFRGEVIRTLGVTLHADGIISQAQSMFARMPRTSPEANLHEPVCAIAVASGGQRAYGRAKSMYMSAPTQEEKTRYLASLCATPDMRLLADTLDMSQTPRVRSQNMHIPIMRIAASAYGAPLVWPWLKRNWSRIHKKVGSGNPLLSRVISSVGIASVDIETADDVVRFFSRNKVPGTERTVAQTSEIIRINARLRAQMGHDLDALS